MWKGTILTSTFFTTKRCAEQISSLELQQLQMNSQEVHPVPIYLTPNQLKWRLKATDTTWPLSHQLHQRVPSWHQRKIMILWPACPWERHIAHWERREKRKAGADPWNIFLIFIPPIFFCFILSGKHSPLAAMHTIPHLLWAKRNELETGELSQRVLAVWSGHAATAGCLSQSSFQLPFTHRLHLCSGEPARDRAGQHQTYSWQCLWLVWGGRRVWTEQTSTERNREGCCVGAGNREEKSSPQYVSG